jgi:hypothetical protein
VVFFTGYVLIAALAFWALTEPPLSVLGDIGPIVTAGIAILLLLGAALAAYSAPSGWYALERVGIGFMSLGVGGYVVATAYAHFTSEGSRAMQLAGLTVGLVMLISRAVVTWGHDWAPREARIV